MTGEQLRDELARIAEAAPEVHVDHDVFDRGRRAHRRAQVLVVAAVVACLALVAGIGWQVSRDDRAPIAEGEARTGVPDHIYGPPDGATKGDLRLSSLEQVGRAAAAYFAEDYAENLVMVSPEGEYFLVRLPDRWEPMLDEVSPVLSPDGTRVAWVTATRARRALAIADLATGDIRPVRLMDDPGALVRSLQWSPDSRRLVWWGQAVTSLGKNRGSYGRVVAGTVGPGAITSTSLPGDGRQDWANAGMCNDGSAVRYLWPTYFASDGDGPVRYGSWQKVTAAHGPCSAPRNAVEIPNDGDSRVLGWLASTLDDATPTAVVLVPDLMEDGSFERWFLRLVGPAGTQDVGTADSAWVDNLSIATGLMTEEQPTVPAGDDPWPESTWRRIQPWLAGGIVLALVAACAWAWVRSRRQRSAR